MPGILFRRHFVTHVPTNETADLLFEKVGPVSGHKSSAQCNAEVLMER